MQYWLRVHGYYLFTGFAALFVANAVAVGGWEAYDVSVQIDSPRNTAIPVLALPLSIAGWLVVTGFAGAVAGYVVTEVTENRNVKRSRGGRTRRRIRHIPLLVHLQFKEHDFDIPGYFAYRFVLRHDRDWAIAQDHWEIVVQRYLEAGDADRSRGWRYALWDAVLEAAYVLDNVDKKAGICPVCEERRNLANGEAGTDAHR